MSNSLMKSDNALFMFLQISIIAMWRDAEPSPVALLAWWSGGRSAGAPWLQGLGNRTACRKTNEKAPYPAMGEPNKTLFC